METHSCTLATTARTKTVETQPPPKMSKQEKKFTTVDDDEESTVKDDRVATFKHSFQSNKQNWSKRVIDQTEGSK